MTRSTRFTAPKKVAFADIPHGLISSAKTIFSIAFLLAIGLDMVLGTIARLIGCAMTASGPSPTLHFWIAFMLVPAVALVGAWDSLRPDPLVGKLVARKKEATA